MRIRKEAKLKRLVSRTRTLDVYHLCVRLADGEVARLHPWVGTGQSQPFQPNTASRTRKWNTTFIFGSFRVSFIFRVSRTRVRMRTRASFYFQHLNARGPTTFSARPQSVRAARDAPHGIVTADTVAVPQCNVNGSGDPSRERSG